MAQSFKYEFYENFTKCIKNPNIKKFEKSFIFNKYKWTMIWKKNTDWWGVWIRIGPLQSDLTKNDPLWQQRKVTVLISHDHDMSDARFNDYLSHYGYNKKQREYGSHQKKVLQHKKLHKDPHPEVTINVRKICSCTKKQKKKHKYSRQCEIHHADNGTTQYYGAYPTKNPNTLTQMCARKSNTLTTNNNNNTKKSYINIQSSSKQTNTLTQMFNIGIAPIELNNNKKNNKNNKNNKTKKNVQKQKKTLTQYFDYK